MLEALNSLNIDIRFNSDVDSDFESGTLSTFDFELWTQMEEDNENMGESQIPGGGGWRPV